MNQPEGKQHTSQVKVLIEKNTLEAAQCTQYVCTVVRNGSVFTGCAAVVHTLLNAAVLVLVAATTTVNEGLAGVGHWVVVEHGEGGAAGAGVGLRHAVICRHTATTYWSSLVFLPRLGVYWFSLNAGTSVFCRSVIISGDFLEGGKHSDTWRREETFRTNTQVQTGVWNHLHKCEQVIHRPAPVLTDVLLTCTDTDRCATYLHKY